MGSEEPQSSPAHRERQTHTIRPFTIKGLLHAEVDELYANVFTSEGAAVTSVVVVGWIREVRMQPAGRTFTVEDGTGSIEASVWTITPEEDRLDDTIKLGALVKVFGELRHRNKRTSIAATHVGEVSDKNYLTYHFLNAIHSHIYYRGVSRV